MPDVTPDDDNDGVLVWRVDSWYSTDAKLVTDCEIEDGATVVSGRWFTTLRAEQLLAIEKAARDRRAAQSEFDPSSFRSASAVTDATDRLHRALDALRPAAPGTPE